MLVPGLVSVTFRRLEPRNIVELARRAGLSAIEWGGDVHVPHGHLARAREVREATLEAGLEVAAYGSYYRAGGAAPDNPDFAAVLETAVELGAPTIRIWAGTAGSAQADEQARWRVITDVRRVADLAARCGITVSFEFHGGTLTDTNESATRLLVEVDHPHVHTFWQPAVGRPPAECLAGLHAVLPRLTNVHCFHWGATPRDRLPLAEGATPWAAYLAVVAATGRRHAVLLEFVSDDRPEHLVRDAATLRGWLATAAAPGPR